MGLPIDAIDAAADLVGEVNVRSFEADPPAIQPFGPGSQLSWNVQLPPRGGSIQLTIDGRSVGLSGSMTVHPLQSRAYGLIGNFRGVHATLREVVVAVDLSECRTVCVPPDLIRPMLQEIADEMARAEGASEREPMRMVIDAGGLEVHLRYSKSVADIDIDFRMRVYLDGVDGRQAIVDYVSYDLNIDLPWWATILSLGFSELIEANLESNRSSLKYRILDRVRGEVYAAVQALGYPLYQIWTDQDGVHLIACPA